MTVLEMIYRLTLVSLCSNVSYPQNGLHREKYLKHAAFFVCPHSSVCLCGERGVGGGDKEKFTEGQNIGYYESPNYYCFTLIMLG